MRNTEENSPTHEQIEARAYEIFLDRGEDSSAVENWLMAEDQLRQEHTSKPATFKSMTATVGQRRL